MTNRTKEINELRNLIVNNIEGEVTIGNVARALVKINPDFIENEIVKDLETIKKVAEYINDMYYNKKNTSPKEVIKNEVLANINGDDAKEGYLETLYYLFDEGMMSGDEVSEFAQRSLDEKAQCVGDEICNISEGMADIFVENIDFDKLDKISKNGMESRTEEDTLVDFATVYYMKRTGYTEGGNLEINSPEMIGVAIGTKKILEKETIRIFDEETEKEVRKSAIREVVVNILMCVFSCGSVFIIGKDVIGFCLSLEIAAMSIFDWIVTILFCSWWSILLLLFIIAHIYFIYCNSDNIEKWIKNYRNKKKLRKAQLDEAETEDEDDEDDEADVDDDDEDEEEEFQP